MPIVYPHKTPMPCRDPEERRRSWDEVAEGYTVERAIAEARRCLNCQDPVCEQGCPVNVPIRDFVRSVAVGDFQGAADTIRRRNLLPAICGRVCPVEHQCELRCVLLARQDPVGIGRLERFVADWEREHGRGGEFAAPHGWRNQKVAIVGSGPAGLTAASDLAQLGYPVSIFEALHAFGGVLRYGIPQYRLPKEIVDDDIEHLKALGVEFVRDVIIGKTVTMDQLFDEWGYSAVFVGTGAGSPIFMDIPGENLKGVYSANEFLTRVNLMRAFSFPEYDTPLRRPRRAAVIGAGDTAMDAVRCAIRLGAEEGHIVYRRSEVEKGARAEDYERALGEGVIFDWLTLPQRFLGDETGWVSGLECIRTELGEPDESGRRRPVPVPGSEFTIEADLVVIALGTNPNPLIPHTTSGLDIDRHGCIVADPQTGATSRQGVFAGGDIVTGAATVILAMGAGRKAANAIHEYLQKGAAEKDAPRDDAVAPAPPVAGAAGGGASKMKIKEAASSDTATFATRPDVRVDDPEAEEYRRGFGDGTVWATDYATEGQLGDLVEAPDRDNPYWQGFIEGVEEVWSTREPPAFGPENTI
ncbi:MAG: NADPH-dependent glutamate synthase [Mycobacterium sp.]|uniref:NADPH-dependent glutamate synthase n=2 Tax=Mycobacterium sp. TaxID=1785 RepID=UPI003F9634CF